VKLHSEKTAELVGTVLGLVIIGAVFATVVWLVIASLL
jgi:hypothetical protein